MLKKALIGLAMALIAGVAHADNFSVSSEGYAKINDSKRKLPKNVTMDLLKDLGSRAGTEMMSYYREMETDLDGHSFENWMLLREELREIYIGAYIQGAINRVLTKDPWDLSTIKARSQMVDAYFDFCLGRKSGAEEEGVVSSFNYYLALARVANGDF